MTNGEHDNTAKDHSVLIGSINIRDQLQSRALDLLKKNFTRTHFKPDVVGSPEKPEAIVLVNRFPNGIEDRRDGFVIFRVCFSFPQILDQNFRCDAFPNGLRTFDQTVLGTFASYFRSDSYHSVPEVSLGMDSQGKNLVFVKIEIANDSIEQTAFPASDPE